MKRTARLLALSMLAALLLGACASAPSRTAGGESSFYTANVDTIVVKTLSNGIPLIVKKNAANRVYSLKVAYSGGVALAPEGKAGIEAMTLALMARGSASYSYDDLQLMQYEKSSAIGSSANGFDWASFDLMTIDKYWDGMFAAFADCVMNPSFAPDQFAQVQNEFRVAAQKNMSDPYSYAVSKLAKKAFAGHPYASDYSGDVESIAGMKLSDLQAYYRDALQADRMVLVAVGDFDADELYKELDGTFGTIPRKGLSVPELPALEIRAALTLEAFEKSKGIAYVRGNYPIAPVQSPDFTALQLAYSMLNELLFSIVRTEHGACYSTWATAHGFMDSYGSLVVYKTDRPAEVKAWVDEAIAILASGKTLNLRGGEGYAEISSTLEAYKAKFVNGFFGNQQTNAQMAAQLASSYIYYGDAVEYLRFIDKVHAVSAEDIVRVMNDYVVSAPVSWIVLSDSATLSKVREDDYLRFTAK